LRIVEQQPEGMFIAWSLHWTSVQTWPGNALLCSAHGALLIFKNFFFPTGFFPVRNLSQEEGFTWIWQKERKEATGRSERSLQEIL
jgi:hypothetical protein